VSAGHSGVPEPAEEAVLFACGEERLFGILTHPPGEPRGVAVVFLQGAGYVPSFNHNRLWVTLSQRIARDGFHAFRFDYRGVGESTGTVARVELDRPVLDDLLAALDCVRRGGVERFVLVGSCAGALTALAASAVPGVESEVLLAPPVLLSPSKPAPGHAETRTAVNPRLTEGVRDAAGRLPLLLMYGREDPYYADFLQTRPLDEVLAGGARLRLEIVPGQIRGLTSLATQRAVAELVSAWLTSEE
jgi:dienelactone hydrolase